MLATPENEQKVLDAVNALANRYNEDYEGMDTDEARNIVCKLLNEMAETDASECGDWVSNGDWNEIETFDEAWEQISAAADQWDELTEEFER